MGVQGIGVKTPKAAAVAAATAGFAILVHMAKGITFIKGTALVILAAGDPPAMTRLMGRISNEEGAIPKAHMHMAFPTTRGMFFSPFL
jgi:hypothetical protein